jgi:hypothetical protein
MQSKRTRVSLWVSLAGPVELVGIVSCSSPGAVPLPTDAGVDTPAVPSSVAVRGFVNASDGSPLPGAQVCVQADGSTDASSCTSTANDGTFMLSSVPANNSVMITFQKEAFVPTLRPIATQTTDISLPQGEDVLLPAADQQAVRGMPANPNRGSVEFFVKTPDAQPATLASITSTGGDGSPQVPIYFDANGAPASGATSGAHGGFVNVPPGLYVLRFGGLPSTRCTPMDLYGWPLTLYQDPSSGQAAVLVPVIQGYVTSPIAALCEKAQQAR